MDYQGSYFIHPFSSNPKGSRPSRHGNLLPKDSATRPNFQAVAAVPKYRFNLKNGFSSTFHETIASA